MTAEKTEKVRLDLYLVEKGYFKSRERARTAIMTGRVLVNEQPISKPGTQIGPRSVIRLRGEEPRFVSRGGLKLARALTVFALELADKVVLDVGASTGGFTDCALQSQAKRVYAVDVGYGQLAWKLRQDPRVIVLERTNIRHFTPEQLPEKVDLATIDVSFISLKQVLPSVEAFLSKTGQVIALIKPQFEAGREKIGKKGVVRDKKVHREIMLNLIHAAPALGFSVQGLTYSPLLGPAGNTEYFIWLHKLGETEAPVVWPETAVSPWSRIVDETIEAAEKALHKKT